jgi:hypothetical protein
MYLLVGVLALLVAGVVGALIAGKLVAPPAPLDVAHPVVTPPRPGAFLRAWATTVAIGAPVVGAAVFRLVRLGMVVRVDARGVWAGALGRDRLVPWSTVTGTWLLERRVASGMTFDRVRYFGATGGRVRVSRLLQRNADDLIDAVEAEHGRHAGP